MQAIIFAREEKGNKERVQLRKKEMVGADGSNGKDGIFCGKEKMQMSVYYSIGSILLGLAAWWIPYAARGNYTLRGKEWVEYRQMVHGDGQRKSE
jgi:hypothetical protein